MTFRSSCSNEQSTFRRVQFTQGWVPEHRTLRSRHFRQLEDDKTRQVSVIVKRSHQLRQEVALPDDGALECFGHLRDDRPSKAFRGRRMLLLGQRNSHVCLVRWRHDDETPSREAHRIDWRRRGCELDWGELKPSELRLEKLGIQDFSADTGPPMSLWHGEVFSAPQLSVCR